MSLAAASQPNQYEVQLLSVIRNHEGEDLSFDKLLRVARHEIDATDLELRQALWHLILEGEIELTGTRTIELPKHADN